MHAYVCVCVRVCVRVRVCMQNQTDIRITRRQHARKRQQIGAT